MPKKKENWAKKLKRSVKELMGGKKTYLKEDETDKLHPKDKDQINKWKLKLRKAKLRSEEPLTKEDLAKARASIDAEKKNQRPAGRKGISSVGR